MFRKLIIFFILPFLYFTPSISNDLKIAYVDMSRILNESSAGKNLTEQIKSLNTSNVNKYKKKEKELIIMEKDLLKKKNILSKEDFEAKVIALQTTIKKFKNDINVSRKDVESKRNKGTAKLFEFLNSILTDYSSKNSITLVLQKKNILIAKSELDITSQILELLNKKVKTIKLK